MTASSLPVIDLASYKRSSNTDVASPFRYPGGKGFLAGYLAFELDRRFPKPPVFVEPYCGGAGAALQLLFQNRVSSIILNDADSRIFSAWKGMLDEPDRFINEIERVALDVTTWNKQLDLVYNSKDGLYDFEVGFATFYINRTSRSGVIVGSGPIGGYDQSGKWKIDARFNRKGLAKKVEAISKLRSRIILSNLDALDFCRGLSAAAKPAETFLFIDPPYIGAGGRLYLNAMNEAKHMLLSEWLCSGEFDQWVLTYDDHPLVREAYAKYRPHHLSVNYSLARKRLEKELLYLS